MKPRLGFLGVGWIGLNRLKAIAGSDLAEIAAVADTDPAAAAGAAAECGGVAVDPEDLLSGRVAADGIVIATPSGLHAAQAERVLSNGAAVFCQKPLGRTAAECESVVNAARRIDRLLGVDFSYRGLRGVRRMRALVAEGAIGHIHAADLIFHNAYGPDKAWCADPALSGGGCVIDLGTHLVDLALGVLGAQGEDPKLESVESRLYTQGRPAGDRAQVEDYAVAQLAFSSGATVRLACSWFLHAGCDAVIDASFYGQRGAVRLRNVNGSFYDFVATHDVGSTSQTLAAPPDDWGPQAALDWTRRLAGGAGFDPAVERVADVARIIDRIYGQ
jgi:predicted dehydrogenase